MGSVCLFLQTGVQYSVVELLWKWSTHHWNLLGPVTQVHLAWCSMQTKWAYPCYITDLKSKGALIFRTYFSFSNQETLEHVSFRNTRPSKSRETKLWTQDLTILLFESVSEESIGQSHGKAKSRSSSSWLNPSSKSNTRLVKWLTSVTCQAAFSLVGELLKAVSFSKKVANNDLVSSFKSCWTVCSWPSSTWSLAARLSISRTIHLRPYRAFSRCEGGRPLCKEKRKGRQYLENILFISKMSG